MIAIILLQANVLLFIGPLNDVTEVLPRCMIVILINHIVWVEAMTTE